MDYLINYEYISKVLCVNKEKPMMHCNGKCHLMKELAKAAENEKPISSNKKDNSKQEVEILFFESIAFLNLTTFSLSEKSSINGNYTNLYVHLNSCSIFHPPSIA